MSPTAGNRHLSRSALEEYFARSVPATIVVPGDPTCRIVIDPVREEMALRTPHHGDEVDVAGFARVHTRLVSADGMTWRQVIVDYRDHGHEAYLLLSDVVDMIQQNGLTPATAVRSALRTFENLLARAGSLSPEQQTGLYGELLFLESCLLSSTADAAVTAWKGFASHEHDFVFPTGSFEIKTTKTEKRIHRIGSLEQMQPLPGKALWLVSVQLTSAAEGGGRSLADVVDDVRKAAGHMRPVLDAALTQAGWRQRDRTLYREPQTLRTVPAAYLVDEGFPVLNRRIVEQGCARPELVVDAAYTIDVTSLERGRPPSPGDRFVEGSS